MIITTVKTTLIEIIIAILIVVLLYIIIKNLRSYEYEKKFSNFSLLSNKDVDVSFFNFIISYFWQLVHVISKLLSYSKVIEKHSKCFESDISLKDENLKKPMDYIAIKTLVGISLVIFYFITYLIGYINLDIMKILIIFIIGYLLPNILIIYRRHKRQQQIEEDLLKAIIIMNNSFKSGRNIMQAIKTVETELEGPIADEFKKISLDISYGLSVDTVFNRFYNRVKIEDAKYIASSLTLLNKTGGNIVKVFSMIEKTFFDKKKLKNELRSLTSSSVFVFRVLVVMPLLFTLVIVVLNKEYFKPLYSSMFGMFILLIVLSLYILYIIIIRKALKVKI